MADSFIQQNIIYILAPSLFTLLKNRPIKSKFSFIYYTITSLTLNFDNISLKLLLYCSLEWYKFKIAPQTFSKVVFDSKFVHSKLSEKTCNILSKVDVYIVLNFA